MKKFKKSKFYLLSSKIKSNFKFLINHHRLKKLNFNTKIKSIDETIDEIKRKNNSVIRLGDGEIRIINDTNIIFQQSNEKLKEYLEKIILNQDEKLMVCLPDTFNNLDRYVKRTRISWTNHIVEYKDTYSKYIKDRVFGNAFISRPYIIFKDKTRSREWFSKIKELWEAKDIVIIEGEWSRIGVGNDLLSEVNSVERIICPPKNAFEKYEEIFTEAKNLDKNKLLLVSLGPAAKPLIYDLTKLGYMSIDIGHIDSEYEWFLSGANKKIKINNKHAADIRDSNVEECNDVDYKKQIIAHIT